MQKRMRCGTGGIVCATVVIVAGPGVCVAWPVSSAECSPARGLSSSWHPALLSVMLF